MTAVENRHWGRLNSGRDVFDSSPQWEREQFRREQQQRDGQDLDDPYRDVPPPDEPPDDAPPNVDDHHAGAKGSQPQNDGLDDARVAALLDGIFTAKWLDGKTFPDIEYVVEDLITEGSNILVAAPKAGKSWLAADLALAVAQGGIALGAIPVKQRRVLYLALEDGKRRLQKRLRQLNRGVGLPEWLELKLMVDPKDATDLIQAYLQRHQRDRRGEPPPWVIIDTFGKVKRNKPAGAEPYLHDYRSGAALKTAIETISGASLLLIHHDRKAEAADYVDAVSGTHGVAGAMDTILVLVRERGSDGAVLKVTGRDIAEAEYALTADRLGGAIHWIVDGADLDAAKAEADRQRCERAAEAKSRNLGKRSLDAVTFVNSRTETTAADLAGYLSIDRKAAGDLLRRLFDWNYIDKGKRGVYVPLFKQSAESAESAESTGQQPNSISAPDSEGAESAESEPPADSADSAPDSASAENESDHLPGNSADSADSALNPGAQQPNTTDG